MSSQTLEERSTELEELKNQIFSAKDEGMKVIEAAFTEYLQDRDVLEAILSFIRWFKKFSK